MADIKTAVDYVLRQEDRNLSGVVTVIPGDNGGRTRFGVAERSHPELTSGGFYDKMPTSQALQVAEDLFSRAYAVGLKISSINSQAIANALLSFGINQGTYSVIRLVQRALGLEEDGVFGPQTLARINQVSPAVFLKSLKILETDRYIRIVQEDPSQHKFFKGWMNRVNENCNICSA